MDAEEFRTVSINANGGDAIEQAAEAGVDLNHLFLHLYETALCTLGSEASLDAGFFVQLTDKKHRTWTFSIVPEDGGLITQGLLDIALEGDRK